MQLESRRNLIVDMVAGSKNDGIDRVTDRRAGDSNVEEKAR